MRLAINFWTSLEILISTPTQTMKHGDANNSEQAGSGKTKDKEQKSVPYYSLFRFSTWLDRILIIVGCLCSMACGVTMPLAMVQFGDSTNYFVNYTATLNSGNLTAQEKQRIAQELMESVKQFAIDISTVGAVAIVLTYIGNTLLSYTASRQAYTIRRLFFSCMLNQDIGWYDVNQTSDFASSVTENLSKIEEGMGEKIAIFLYCETVFVSGIIFSLILGWELALVCFVSLPVTSITMGIVTWLTAKFAEKELDAYAAASSVAEEALRSVRTVVAFEGQAVESERYSKHLIHAMSNNIRRSLFSGINNAILWFCVYGSYALAFWYGVELIIRERNLEEAVYTPGNVVSVFFCSIMSTWFFGMGAPYLEVFSTASGAAVKIFGVIENKPVINASKGVGKTLRKVEGNISFRDVHFEYPSRTGVKVLDGLNLNVRSGEKVALVGSSGCGKSTTVQLIQRFYDPLSGEVTLDGHNIKNFDLKWFRSNIGVVSQEPVLFAATIYENIKYGNKEATRADVERAAKRANAHDFISGLPQGYNTLIGERGAQLSGGQKQRIAIARALVREPVVLLLDEATSALDTTSEAMVQAALDSASSGCTTIIVAHRLSTVRNADRILVFSGGKVAEEGNHQELIAKKGLYYNLVSSQETSTEGEQDNKQLLDEAAEERVDLEVTTSEDVRGHDELGDYTPDVTKEVRAVIEVMKLNRPEWLEIVIGCLSSILTGAALPVYSLVFGDIIGVLSETDNATLRSGASVYCLYFLAIGIVTGIATFFQIHLFSRAGEKLTKRVRRLMFESMMRQEMGWFDLKENGVGALCTRLSTDASLIQGASGQCVGTLLNSMSTFIISFVLALYLHWKIALVALSFSPLIFVSIYYEQKIVGDVSQTKKSLEGSSKVAIEAIGSVRTVASLGCEESFYKLYDSQLRVHLSSTVKKSHFRALMMGLARALMFFCYAAALYYGAHLIVTTDLFYGVVFKVSECVVVGSWSIGNAVAYSPNFQKGLAAANEAFKLLNRVPKICNFHNPLTQEWKNSAITYKDIHFSYPTRPTSSVLRGMNLSVLEGKTTALVGSSGCGKSTLIQLLERFYDPNRGDLQVDGNSLRYMDLKMVRSQLGIVSQEPNLFNRTIAENIAYGANGRQVSMEEILDASKKANIYSFITSLPLGYDTKLGDRATQLSGGQKQRIAIARALVRNPKVLLLDEATSALDNESEKVVQEALDNAMKGRTCITIAHRLTTIQDADVICVVNEGRVAEIGKHSDLLSRKGLYYRFYQLQSGH